MVDTDRRRFLQVAGAGAGFGLAGCTELGSDDEPTDSVPDVTDESTVDDTDEEGATDDSGSVPDVAVIVQIDEAAFQQRQQELQEKLQEDEIDQMEFQAELQEYQQELIEEAFDAFEGDIDDSLDIDERVAQQGAILVSGDPETVLGTLAYESVAGLINAEELDPVAP